MKLRARNGKMYGTAIDFDERELIRKILQLMGSNSKVTITMQRVLPDDPYVRNDDVAHSIIIEC